MHRECLKRKLLYKSTWKGAEDMASSKAGIVNLKEFTKNIENLNKASEKVLTMTVKDFKKRAPTWIAEEVVQKYNIAKTEVKPKKQGETKLKTGHLSFKGTTVESVTIVYKGRRLTPIHFKGATKKTKHPGTGQTTVKATIKNGGKSIHSKGKKITKKQRENIGRNFTQQGTRNSPSSPIMMLHTGNKQPGGTNYIPFQRQSQRRDDLKATKTVSMPQMVSNEEVSKNINEAINVNLGKRFDHYLNRYMPVEKK